MITNLPYMFLLRLVKVVVTSLTSSSINTAIFVPSLMALHFHKHDSFRILTNNFIYTSTSEYILM